MNKRFTKPALASLAVIAMMMGAACKGDSKPTAVKPVTNTSASGAPAVAIKTTATGTKVGLIVSSGGPGADLKDMAAGAYVAAFRLNGASAKKDNVELIVADDNGTADGAVSAIADLASKDVVGVVYASTGEQMLAGVAKAAELGMPVVMPYADDVRLTEQGATAYMAAPSVPQVAKELADHISKAGYSKVALVRQAGPYGDAGRAALSAAGLTFASDTPITGDEIPGKAIAAGNPDAVIVWAEAAPAVAVADSLSSAGSSAAMLFSDRAAVPAFGHSVVSSLAPAVGDGAVSVGSWAGPDTPTAAVDAFFLAKDKAVSSGATTADLSSADFRSHDAVLAIVAAAAQSHSRAGVLDALKQVATNDLAGHVGAPLDFSSQQALKDDDVALLSYSTIDDGSGRYPSVETAGGHWLAVAGTYSLPEALKGLDNPYGG